MRKTTALMTTTLALAAGPSGCRDPDTPVTPRGLGEENRVLRGAVADLRETSTAMKAERQEIESALRRDRDDQLARLRRLHGERVAQLEGEIAALRLELGATHRERLALRTALDRRPRLEAVRQTRSWDAVTSLAALLAVTLAALGAVAARNRSLRTRLNAVAVRLGAAPPAGEG